MSADDQLPRSVLFACTHNSIRSPMAAELMRRIMEAVIHSLKADIRTVNLNPSVAFKVNDKVSLGFGVNYQKIDAKLTNLTHIGVPVSSELKGDDTAWGWNAGALFTLSPAMRRKASSARSTTTSGCSAPSGRRCSAR